MLRSKTLPYLESLTFGDQLYSAITESAINRVLTKHTYPVPVRRFVGQIRQIPWIIEALSSMAAIRWRNRWSNPDEFADAIVLARGYLEASGFFSEETSEDVRMGFSVFLMDVTVERAGRPSPEKVAPN